MKEMVVVSWASQKALTCLNMQRDGGNKFGFTKKQ